MLLGGVWLGPLVFPPDSWPPTSTGKSHPPPCSDAPSSPNTRGGCLLLHSVLCSICLSFSCTKGALTLPGFILSLPPCRQTLPPPLHSDWVTLSSLCWNNQFHWSKAQFFQTVISVRQSWLHCVYYLHHADCLLDVVFWRVTRPQCTQACVAPGGPGFVHLCVCKL